MVSLFLKYQTYPKGTCELSEFAKAIEKIGVQVGSKKDMETLFRFYDKDGS
jgi:Ca2+-binding EF-hand superfamily protein